MEENDGPASNVTMFLETLPENVILNLKFNIISLRSVCLIHVSRHAKIHCGNIESPL
jgi:hypothetical protein